MIDNEDIVATYDDTYEPHYLFDAFNLVHDLCWVEPGVYDGF